MKQLVRIYKPAKTAMQSGRAITHKWVLEFEPTEKARVEPLMGWSSSGNTQTQVKLNFDTLDEALAYAERHEYLAQVTPANERQVKPKSYADNFRFDRLRD